MAADVIKMTVRSDDMGNEKKMAHCLAAKDGIAGTYVTVARGGNAAAAMTTRSMV